jgi:hypothetical protein
VIERGSRDLHSLAGCEALEVPSFLFEFLAVELHGVYSWQGMQCMRFLLVGMRGLANSLNRAILTFGWSRSIDQQLRPTREQAASIVADSANGPKAVPPTGTLLTSRSIERAGLSLIQYRVFALLNKSSSGGPGAV